MRPCKQLCDRGCDVWETHGIDHCWSVRPDDAHHCRHAVRFDKLNVQVIVVDLTGRQRGDGMLG